MTTGATLEETERIIKEAMRGHVQALCEFEERVPEPASVLKNVDIATAVWG